MLSEHDAQEIRFAGLGANAATAAAAAEQLASALREWCARQEGCRLLQLSVLSAVPGGTVQVFGYGAMAVIAYVEESLSNTSAARAVAAAVEEIHEAQAGATERTQQGGSRSGPA
jgi:hypothetical protein